MIKVIKRGELTLSGAIASYSLIALAALILGGAFVALSGVNPFEYFTSVFLRCFKTQLAVQGLVNIFTTLLIVSLGVTVAFKLKFWNIGAEGQVIIGAVGATLASRMMPDSPPYIVLPAMMITAVVFAGIYGMIPAALKCRFGTNETLLTLMMNYIAFYLVDFLQNNLWNEGKGFPKIASLLENSHVPRIIKFDVSVIIALVLVVLVYFYLKKTKQGYEIAVTGDSENTARYAGMNVTAVTLRTVFISAGIAGLAGVLKVAGDSTNYTLSSGIASNVGFTAISVAWLARLHPVGVVFVTLLFAILEKGCSAVESTFFISSAVTGIIKAIVLFVILGGDFFLRYRIKLGGGKAE
ncbi:ABC transporter permease [Clostridia bacterium]|nr:ABC transporter permease [Clostridia bacterium]